jgi:hypothetical protein
MRIRTFALALATALTAVTIGLMWEESELTERLAASERHSIARCLYTESGSMVEDDGSVTTWLPGGRVVSVRWDSATSAQILAWNDPCVESVAVLRVTAPCADVWRDNTGTLRARLVNGQTGTIGAEDDCPERGDRS